MYFTAPRAKSANPIKPKVAGSGIAAVLTEPDHVLEKIPVGELAAAATAAMVVSLNWPEIASVKAAEESTPDVSITMPLIVIETVTLLAIWDSRNPPMHVCVAVVTQVAGTN